MKNVGGCWMCVYQNGSDYLLFAASMMCAHFNYKTPDRRAAAGWKSICRQFLSRLEFSPFPAIFAFTSLCLRQAGRRQPRHRDSCAARRQIRHSNHQVLSGSWFSPRRQYFTPWQPPAACMCWWCSDVSIIAEVQKRSGCQNILNSFIISAKKNNCFEIIKLFVSEASSWLIMSICSGALHWLPRQADTWATK